MTQYALNCTNDADNNLIVHEGEQNNARVIMLISCLFLWWFPCIGLPLLIWALSKTTIDVKFNDKEKRIEITRHGVFLKSRMIKEEFVDYDKTIDFEVVLLSKVDSDADDFNAVIKIKCTDDELITCTNEMEAEEAESKALTMKKLLSERMYNPPQTV
ncbi:PurT [Acrasis kona]|uniref:PurT n=1 Tax=Acrasis kona TaxID=1008807 RepID=A0AAW2YN68_9EUKA